MRVTISELIKNNPSGLLELKKPVTIAEYRENFGLRLKNVWTIYKSGKLTLDGKPWFAHQERPLEELLNVKEISKGNLLVVFIVETIIDGKINCQLVLKNKAFQELVSDPTCHVLQVHQMYQRFFKDHIELNIEEV